VTNRTCAIVLLGYLRKLLGTIASVVTSGGRKEKFFTRRRNGEVKNELF